MASKNEIKNHVIVPADDHLIQELGLAAGYSIGGILMSSNVKKIKRANEICQMPALLLVRGLPGSGKSTLAKSLCLKGYSHIESDRFFKKKSGYAFDVRKLKEAHARCLKETRKSMKFLGRVVVSNCFAKIDQMTPYLNLSPNALIIETTGSWKNVHGVKQETIDNMAQGWQAISY